MGNVAGHGLLALALKASEAREISKEAKKAGMGGEVIAEIW